MKLTYENIKETIQTYYNTLPTIKGQQDATKLLDYFTPDFQVRFGVGASILNTREEWVVRLCGHTAQYRSIIHFEPAPLGITIDERRGTASVMFFEELVVPETGEYFSPLFFGNTYFEFCIHENKVKAKREIICHMPGYLEDVELPEKFYSYGR